MELNINGELMEAGDLKERRLVYVLRDTLGLTGTRFGCGAGFCGNCTVWVDGQLKRSCLTPADSLVGKAITTIEGLAATYDPNRLHPVQQAFIDEQVPQCGWCMSGQIMTAAALLNETPNPSDEDILAAMEGNYCRCGTYHRIKRAIRRAAEVMAYDLREEVRP